MAVIEKIVRYAISFSGDAGHSYVGSKSTSEEFTKQWMKTIFFCGFPVAGDGKKNIFTCQLGEHRRAMQLGKQATANIEVERVEKRKL